MDNKQTTTDAVRSTSTACAVPSTSGTESRAITTDEASDTEFAVSSSSTTMSESQRNLHMIRDGDITDILYPNYSLYYNDLSSFLRDLNTFIPIPDIKVLSLQITQDKNDESIFYVSEPVRCGFCQGIMSIYFHLLPMAESYLYATNAKDEVRPCLRGGTLKLVHRSCLEDRSNLSLGCNYRFKISRKAVPISQWWKNRDGVPGLIKSMCYFILYSIMICSMVFVCLTRDPVPFWISCFYWTTLVLIIIYTTWKLRNFKRRCISNWTKWCRSNQKLTLILWKPYINTN